MRAIRVISVLKRSLILSGVLGAVPSLTACTDAESLPPLATVAMHFGNDPAKTGSCSTMNQAIESIPKNDADAARLSSSTVASVAATMPRVKDGADGATVECVVTDGGGVFEVDAYVKQGNLNFRYRGTIPGTGTGHWFSQANLTALDSPSCTAEVDETYEGGGGIRATVRCPGAVVANLPSVQCEISGSFLVERCDK